MEPQYVITEIPAYLSNNATGRDHPERVTLSLILGDDHLILRPTANLPQHMTLHVSAVALKAALNALTDPNPPLRT